MKRLLVVASVMLLSVGLGVAAVAAGLARPGMETSSLEGAELSPSASLAAASVEPPKTLRYVPLPEGCRLFDTRQTSGPFTSGSFRDLSVTGSDLSGQGGDASGCDVPGYAAAIDLSLSTTGGSPTAVGYARLGEGGVKPVNTVIQFLQGQGTSVTTTTNVSTAGEIRLQVYNASTHFVGDLVGYWQENPRGLVLGSGGGTATVFWGRSVQSAERVGVGDYTVTLVEGFGAYGECVLHASPVSSTHHASILFQSTGTPSVLQIRVRNDANDFVDGQVWFSATC